MLCHPLDMISRTKDELVNSLILEPMLIKETLVKLIDKALLHGFMFDFSLILEKSKIDFEKFSTFDPKIHRKV